MVVGDGRVEVTPGMVVVEVLGRVVVVESAKAAGEVIITRPSTRARLR